MAARGARGLDGGRGLIRLEEEAPGDWWEVEALYDLCFAPGREALSSYRLREGVPPVAALCLVARDSDGTLASAIRHWPVLVGEAPSLLLGPVAGAPASLECRVTQIVQIEGAANFVVFGRVTGVHMRDDCLVDGVFDLRTYQPLTRLGYQDYSRITELFRLPRPGEGD